MHGFFNEDYFARWTLPYLDIKKATSVKRLLHMLEEKGMVDISYRNYDWNLNKL
jgi:hypothetical protein